MSNINNKYKNIIDEIEDKIKNKEDLDFVKEKFTELSVFFIDIIDKLTSITNARLNEIEESQREIDNKISKVQSVVNNIENDIYADDENCESVLSTGLASFLLKAKMAISKIRGASEHFLSRYLLN